MKYSITVLQAEVTRFKHAINSLTKRIINDKIALKDKDCSKGTKGKLILTKNIEQHESIIAMHEKGIIELKADIKKL